MWKPVTSIVPSSELSRKPTRLDLGPAAGLDGGQRAQPLASQVAGLSVGEGHVLLPHCPGPVAWEAQWKAVALAAAQSAKLCAGAPVRRWEGPRRGRGPVMSVVRRPPWVGAPVLGWLSAGAGRTVTGAGLAVA